MRYRGITWMYPDLALVNEGTSRTARLRTWAVNPSAPSLARRRTAFNSVGASGDSIMIARGVFPRTVKSRAGGGGGGGGGGEGRSNFQLDEQGVRDALNNYLKPYLRG